jgi:glycosyltransferase involved in cell wall biosynthesis
MILVIRASHANEFELQNYVPIADKLHIQVVTSQSPLTSVPIASTKLWSPTDLPDLLMRRQLLNRLIGGEQWLVGLDDLVSSQPLTTNQKLIIHTAETYTPYTHQSVQLRKRGEISKLVCTCWETIPHANEKFSRLRKWKQEAYMYVDIFHTPTQRAKQTLVAEGVNPEKIMVIPYGVDLNRFKPVKLPKNKTPLILTVARLEKEKGMEDIELVAASLPQFDFLIVGRGTYQPLGDNIKTISVPYSEIHKQYQKADLFFLPSRTTPMWEEQYGMALVEAMATGLSIITTNSGAIPEVIGPAGVILPEQDVPAMVESIDGFLSYDCTVKTLARAGRARAERLYDSKKVARELSRLYL